METLETIKLDKMQELARYRQRPDAKPYVINKLKGQIAALENCVDLNDSKVDNQLLILLRDTLYKALYVEGRADVLIVGMRLTNRPEIERVDLVDLVYSTKLNDPQTGLYELLEIGRCIRSDKAVARLTFRHILEGLDARCNIIRVFGRCGLGKAKPEHRRLARRFCPPGQRGGGHGPDGAVPGLRAQQLHLQLVGTVSGQGNGQTGAGPRKMVRPHQKKRAVSAGLAADRDRLKRRNHAPVFHHRACL